MECEAEDGEVPRGRSRDQWRGNWRDVIGSEDCILLLKLYIYIYCFVRIYAKILLFYCLAADSRQHFHNKLRLFFLQTSKN